MAVLPAGPLPPGTLIDGRYEVGPMRGAGSFGEVYEVVDRFQATVVALKLLRRLAGPNPWQEAQVLTQLRSPYILPVWNASHFAGVPYLVTELATHGTTADRIPPCGVTPNDAVAWTRAACRGAARTHDSGLVHRDIKPENLFLGDQNRALLGDFGIAHLMDVSGHAPQGGTPETMAPEVAAGGPTSVVTDVYSLGATLFALLAGRFAHTGPDPAACMASVANDPPRPLRDLAPHVGRALAQRVLRAMARAPADRYTTPAEFDAALGDLPSPERYWFRTDEHAAGGHTACWRGVAAGKAEATVCAVPAGPRFEVLAQHQPSGRRITSACRRPAPASRLPQNLRAALAAVP